MTTYEFYWEGEEGKAHFFGTLPERRDPERITEESILNWGKMLVGNSEKIKKIYFIKVED
jgi:hypothetical protein